MTSTPLFHRIAMRGSHHPRGPAASFPDVQQQALRSRLFQLAVVGILPLAALSGIGLYALIEGQREQAMRTSIEFVRATGVAVDGELRRTVSGLELLGTSPELDKGDARAFEPLAARALATERYWRALVLSDGDGRVVLDVRRSAADASPAPPAAIPKSLPPADRGGVIGNLVADGRGGFVFGATVPIVRDGVSRYALTAIVTPDAIRQVLEQQRIPDDWVVSIFDSASVRVSRSRAHERYLGHPASPTLGELMQGGKPEGAGITQALEGDRVVTAYTRFRRDGWIAAVGIAPDSLLASSSNSLAAFSGGIALSIVLGLLAALMVARSISRPMRSLRDAALSLGRGEPPRPQPSGIAEIDEVATALVDSAQQRARVESEREDLLGAERWARNAAEEARRRLELLASAGATLSRSLEPQATLDAIAHIIVPAISDWCRVDLVDHEGTLSRALTYHSDPEQTRIGAELVARLRAAPETPGSMAWTVATGRSHLARFDAPNPFDSIRDRDLLAFAEAIGMRAYFIVPLTARGRTLGALAALQAESNREFTPDDCALITELAQRAALALDNARLFAEADRARRDADRANRSKDEFLAMLGHELRNPLAPIVTALHLMERKNRLRGGSHGGDEAERRIIERQVAHLSRLVDDLLDVSRITQGKVQLERQPLDLRSIVDRALELVQPLSDRRAKAIDVDVPADPVTVVGDGVRLTQVVTNLLTNAIKFTQPDRRIAVTLGTERVGQDAVAVLTVADDGRGIAPDLLPRVFELFVQGRQSIDRTSGGLGLGLAIVRTMVEMHGGTVDAASDGPDRGARFVIRLPLVRTPAIEATPADASRGPVGLAGAAAASSGLRILVVDDNADAAATLSAMLEMSGHQAQTAPDAPSALEVMDRFIPDIAILDIGLPGIDGYELARQIRAEPRARAVRLIALTGYGREPDRVRALASSFEEHLVKPVSPEVLLASIARMAPPIASSSDA